MSLIVILFINKIELLVFYLVTIYSDIFGNPSLPFRCSLKLLEGI